MKLRPFRSSLIAAFFALALISNAARGGVITREFGSGADVTHLVLQFAGAVDSLHYTFHFDGSVGTPFTGAALLLAIDQADPQLSLIYTGSISKNFFLTDVSYDGYSEPTFEEEGTFYWTSFLSGGKEQAYDEDFKPIPGQFNAVPSGSWNFSSAGASDRIVESGSWDAWVFGEYDENFIYAGAMPSVSPVPEPRTFVLLAVGGLALVPVLRRRHA